MARVRKPTSARGKKAFLRSPTSGWKRARQLVEFAPTHMGPHNPDPIRRSQSPVRSAMRGFQGPNEQLQAEHREAEQQERKQSGSDLMGLLSEMLDREGEKPFSAQSQTLQDALALIALTLDDMSPDEAAQFSDEAICMMMERLKWDVQDFAESFPHVTDDTALERLLVQDNAQLIRYVGCLAQGGPSHIAGWRKMLSGDCATSPRNAIVYGIVGRALKEHVFGELYFGASGKLAETLTKMETDQINHDGFYRTEKRATAIMESKQKVCSVGTDKAVARLALQLEELLVPFWSLSQSKRSWDYDRQGEQLVHIINKAVVLNRWMRANPDVVYYMTYVFKDEEFDPGRMECYNLESMIKDSPYDKQTINEMERAILRPGQAARSEAVVAVVCLPGLVAYRQGGGSLASKELDDEDTDMDGDHFRIPPDVRAHRKRLAHFDARPTIEGGFRTRTICKSVVYLEWSQQRLLTKEAGTSVHINAMNGRNGKTMKRYEDDNAKYAELNKIFQEVIAGRSVEEQARAAGNESPGLMSWLPGWRRSGSVGEGRAGGGQAGSNNSPSDRRRT